MPSRSSRSRGLTAPPLRGGADGSANVASPPPQGGGGDGVGEAARDGGGSPAGALAQASRERRDVVSGAVMPEDRLIRFVAGPDGSVVPDLGRKLPGRGVWVEATREAVAAAVKRNGFARSAKAPLKPAADLPDLVEALLARRCLEQLGLARREGMLISGFEKTLATVASGKAGWLIQASDGAADGRRKMLAARARSPRPDLPVFGAFSADELGLAIGGANVIHLALLAGRRSQRWTEEVRKLAGFRRLFPEDWLLGAGAS